MRRVRRTVLALALSGALVVPVLQLTPARAAQKACISVLIVGTQCKIMTQAGTFGWSYRINEVQLLAPGWQVFAYETQTAVLNQIACSCNADPLSGSGVWTFSGPVQWTIRTLGNGPGLMIGRLFVSGA